MKLCSISVRKQLNIYLRTDKALKMKKDIHFYIYFCIHIISFD